MSRRMLIDGTHPEEIRVVVTSGNRLEEYDVETSTKKQLKGNVYLAKVTRVEPSLQAAFVDFGGNRHGFLSFNEIHPDYYQIPVADREALIAEQERLELDAPAAQERVEEMDGGVDEGTAEHEEDAADGDLDAAEESPEPAANADEDPEADEDPDSDEAPDADEEGGVDAAAATDEDPPEGSDSSAATDEGEAVSAKRSAEGAEEPVQRRRRPQRRYKIQEVIRRRQILLVQVVKEERGNKGAALTTYVSLAGRYCVLMPNTARGGGISRKITNQTSRRKLKTILNGLDVPEGMGVILRTAGLERNKTEIKRDFEYLLRAWDEVRELTLRSTAPTLVYEEASLIKRAIRDLYDRDMEEVLVEGTEAYQTAKKFMRLLMPSHAKRVQPARDEGISLFHRYQVENQLDAMHSPEVRLPSGGYLVIHTTEALVAIDVNSGRSTRERNIEETAVKTNSEAADEVARQLRLRDLAGLVVIDFIDMEEKRHIRQVEKRLKDAMKNDRARIQLGHISPFGLLELSRQRLRPSLLEASTEVCRYCKGTGFVRSTESTALHVLRAIEEEGARQRTSQLTVGVPTAVALYILNQKRESLAKIEANNGFRVLIAGDESVIAPDMWMDRLKGQPTDRPERTAISIEDVAAEDAGDEAPAEVETEADGAEHEETGRRRPRRRRGRRKSTDEATVETAEANAEPAAAETGEESEQAAADDAESRPRRRRRSRRKTADDAAVEAVDATAEPAPAESGEEAEQAVAAAEGEEPRARRRRRGRRGGRRNSRQAAAGGDAETVVETETPIAASDAASETDSQVSDFPDTVPTEQPEIAAWPESQALAVETPEAVPEFSAGAEPATNGSGDEPAEALPTMESDDAGEDETAAVADIAATVEAAPRPDETKRRGWWQRLGE